MNLDGVRAVITGAGSGLGRALCLELARRHGRILLSDKNVPDDIEHTPDMYPANGLRYFVMARPLPATTIARQLPPDAIGHEIDELRRGLRRAR